MIQVYTEFLLVRCLNGARNFYCLLLLFPLMVSFIVYFYCLLLLFTFIVMLADNAVDPSHLRARRVGEVISSTVGAVTSVIDYPRGKLNVPSH